MPIANQNSQVLPASFDLAELTADINLYHQLAPILDALKPVFEKLKSSGGQDSGEVLRGSTD